MLWPVINLVTVALFDNFALLKNDDSLTDLWNNGQIVGDEDHGEVASMENFFQ